MGSADRSSGEAFYRADLQGLRTLTAFIIMIYHIWIVKVSGGVDVLFVVSGFLITSRLLRSLAHAGRIDLLAYAARIAARILPSALFVAVATALATLAFVPPPLWKFGVNEFVASVLQIENWELYRQATDYLARDNPPSQFQQFWALSIQVQFYLIIPLVFLLSPAIAGRQRRLAVALGLIFAASFAWSIHFTRIAPAEAYFSLFTRLWEFMAGALTALIIPLVMRRRIHPALAAAAYGLAVAVIAGAGLLIPADLHFPGWIAAVPVLATVVFVLAGPLATASFPVKRLLSTPPMTTFGNLAFTIYLWHWPLLVFTQQQLGTTRLSPLAGLGVIVAALALSLVTARFVERPALEALRAAPPLRALAIFGLAVGLVAGCGLAIRSGMIAAANAELRTEGDLTARRPLAGTSAPTLRAFVLSNYDRPRAISACLNGPICSFGDPDAAFLVALVGHSHAAQWQPVLDEAGKTYGFRLVTILTNDDAEAIIDRLKPDAVVTTSTVTGIYDGIAARERVPPHFVRLWQWLAAKGIPVIAIRDNPRFQIYQNACVWRYRDDPDRCALDKDKIYAPDNPADAYEQTLAGFHSVDLSSLYCEGPRCPAVIGDQLVYYDRNHFSNGFMRRIAPAATELLMQQTDNLLDRRSVPAGRSGAAGGLPAIRHARSNAEAISPTATISGPRASGGG